MQLQVGISAAMGDLLEVEELSVRYGGVHALQEVSMSVPAGGLIGLIGANGAGKTTLIDAVTGFVRCEGSVTFDGRDVTRMSPHRRFKIGLARTWQSVGLFPDLTVEENLLVACQGLDLGLGRRRARPAAVGHGLALMGLTAHAEQHPYQLSQGQQKLVGVARTLVGHPELVCMDEPAAGLDSNESAVLGKTLRRLADDGTAILLVDHDTGLIMSICDRVHVLEFGQLIASGSPAEVVGDEAVIRSYLGERIESVGGSPA